MHNYQSLIIRIETALANFNLEERNFESLIQLSREYARACRELNSRLRLCNSFLKNGNQSEAVRISFFTPDLLELATILSFDELERWNELCAMNPDFEKAEVLLYRTLEDLRQARQQEGLRHPLLARFRLLSLIHGSIEERLRIICKMRNLEPENLIWEKLTPQFEEACTEELEEEYQRARISSDGGVVITQLAKKIKEIPWQKFPSELYNNLEHWNRKLVLQYSIERIRALVGELHKAYCEQDLERAEELEDERQSIIKSRRLRPGDLPPDLEQQVAPVLVWMNERQRQEEVRQEFEDCLDETYTALECHQSPEELDAAFRELVRVAELADENIPDSLVHAVEREFQLSERQRQRRIRLICSVTIFAILFLGTSMFLYIRNTAIQEQTALEKIDITSGLAAYEKSIELKREKNIDGAADYAGLERAEKRLATLQKEYPRVYNTADIRDLAAETVKVRNKENIRLTAFKKNFKLAQDSYALVKSRSQSGEKVTPSGTLNEKALAEAENKAVTETERTAVLSLKSKFSELFNQEQQRAEELFNKEYNVLFNKYNQLKNQKKENSVYQTELLGLKVKIVAIPSLYVSETLKNKKSNLLINVQSKIDEVTKNIQTATFHDSLVEDLRNIVGELKTKGEYRKFLKQFNDKKPKPVTSLEIDLKKVAGELDIQDFFDEWNLFLEKNRDCRNILALNTDKLSALKKEIESMKTSKVVFADRDRLLTRLEELNVFLGSGGGNAKVFQELSDFWSKYDKDLLFLKTDDKKYYYLTEKPRRTNVNKEKERKLIIKYKESATDEKKEGEVSTMYASNNFGPAPHTKLALDLKPKIDLVGKSKDVNSVRQGHLIKDMLRQLLRDSDIDPVVQLIMLKGIIDIISKNPVYRYGFDSWRGLFPENFDFEINWYNPERVELQECRELAAQTLKELKEDMKSLDEIFQLVQEYRDNSVGQFQKKFTPVAILYLFNGQWVCLTQQSHTKISGPVYIAREGGSPGTGEIIVFEKIVDNVLQIEDDSKKAKLLQGLPVYVLEEIGK